MVELLPCTPFPDRGGAVFGFAKRTYEVSKFGVVDVELFEDCLLVHIGRPELRSGGLFINAPELRSGGLFINAPELRSGGLLISAIRNSVPGYSPAAFRSPASFTSTSDQANNCCNLAVVTRF